MTVQEIANQLVALGREGKREEALSTLFSPDLISEEPEGSKLPTTKGMKELQAKGKLWVASIESFHSSSISDPVFGDNYFSISLNMEVTFKGAPSKVISGEICVYEVRDGKIVKEKFFYTV
jgi:hypothetical protein